MKDFFKSSTGLIICGIVFTTLSFTIIKDKVELRLCMYGLLFIVLGAMRGVWGEERNFYSNIGSRKEGLMYLLLGLLSLFINIFFLWHNSEYVELLFLFSAIFSSVGILMMLLPASLNISDKQDEGILDSYFEKKQNVDMLQKQFEQNPLAYYWKNMPETAKYSWVVGTLIGIGVYFFLLYFLNN